MKVATIFLFVLSILSLIPQKNVEILPLLETEVSIVITGEAVDSQEIKVHSNSQVKDVLKKVEISESADLSSLNMNEYVYQDMVIHIKKKEKNQCVSINRADLDTLITLHGIGEATAQKIINYRSQAPFIYLEDLMNVPSIGMKKFEKIKDDICL